MAHLGVLCYHGAGHLNPLIALSRELASRGHAVTFFLPSDMESQIREQGLGFVPIDVSRIEPKVDSSGLKNHATSEWHEDLRARLCRFDQEIGVYIREYLAAISDSGIDALLMGEITLTGPTVAEILHIPYCVVSTSIPHNFGWDARRALPPRRTGQKECDARIFEVTIFSMKGPVLQILNRHRREMGLESLSDIGATFPELAHVTQWPKCLDIERQELPERFFYAGPFVDEMGRCSVDFPWHKLNGQPLIYASLGTTRKADPEIYQRIASACAGLNLQLVITLGGRRNLESFANLPGNPIVVANAPQLDLLKRADLVITHAGPNTVLETLLSGLPMLALPLALDQPAVAARLETLGLAEVLSVQHCSEWEIRAAVLRLLTESRFRESATAVQSQLQSLCGAKQAASILERAIANHTQIPSFTSQETAQSDMQVTSVAPS
ncbi:MAG TPA: nucleotide disphospho-sugar-binding domain-containing protein [Acidobacteriaceae bacterium]|nr:nucleotide disphospho-sugar-binding domain-containing protein [Acidobacteriaceae bacterium]